MVVLPGADRSAALGMTIELGSIIAFGDAAKGRTDDAAAHSLQVGGGFLKSMEP